MARENIDVFAVVVGPGFGAGVRVDLLVQSQDLYPTLLAAADLPVPELPPETRLLAAAAPDRVAITVSEPDVGFRERSGGRVGSRRYVASQRGSRRVVWSDTGPLRGEAVPGASPVAYAIEADAELAAVARRIARRTRAAGVAGDVPEDLQESLRALGYLE